MQIGPCPPFATLLRRYRQAAGLSQEELAERARLSGRTIGDFERAVSHAPRKDTVELLAQTLALGASERAALVEAARRLSTAASALPGPAGTSSPPLVGRCPELALLERLLRGQVPAVLLLAGSRASARPACCRRPSRAPSRGVAYPHTCAVSILLTLLGAVRTNATGGGSHGRRPWTREAVTSRELGGIGHAELPF
jgi:transcriptional regulator with XRE-family HTH domain